jgi:hypothetical protein
MDRLATANGAEIVDDDVVVFDASVSCALHAIQDFDDRSNVDFEPCFFEHLTCHRTLKRLAELHDSSRQAPFALERRVPAPYQQDPIVMEDDRSDAHDRPSRISPQILESSIF